MKAIKTIILFFVLFICGFHALPYLITNESYKDNTAINNNFFIVLSSNKKPVIINWKEYKLNSVKSNATLYQPSKEVSFKLERNEMVTIKPIRELYQVNVYKDDYTFYCI